MILIFGGTTEGRIAVETAEEAHKEYYYSTLSQAQQIDAVHAIRITGGMDAYEIERFCREKQISLLIDAAHPFAVGLHEAVAEASSRTHIPVIRFERHFPPHDKQLHWCSGYEEAIDKLQSDGIHNLLALTGVKTIARLSRYWQVTPCWFRILERDDSMQIARQSGFPAERLLFFHEGKDELVVLKEIRPDAILTKESGESGYFNEKIEAARQYGIPVYVIERPTMPESFITVHTKEELRRTIVRLSPGFFPLRSGFTTGACATAAAKAAMQALITGKEQKDCCITLPSGELRTLPVAATTWIDRDSKLLQSTLCTVIKNAGDDPDVTNGCSVIARISLSKKAGIHFMAGEGVGIVTLPGLGIEIGEPAINATPRRMITSELNKLLENYTLPEGTNGIMVTLSVPGGRELAARTFNPKLGITGGISIIGTSGIVRPFSNEAFIASIRKEAEVAKAMGCGMLVINSGAKSERFLKKEYPGLSPQAFIQYGNFIGETLKIAASLSIPQVALGIMIGKAVKLAEGFLDTHSKKVIMNKEFLKVLAQESRCPTSVIRQIDHITLARELWLLIPEEEQPAFFSLLLDKCYKYCAPLLPDGLLSILLITEEGNIAYRI